ncbi:MAG: DegT/DnrJ/EryC1/StrS family aminotransferase [Chloroflexota bacterium]|nr:DegT/DnrJ/EryC1/StrS family aminotransferase [Chloroflexota bacterium]
MPGAARRGIEGQLNEAGVGTGIFYPVPAHQHDYMRDVVGDVHLPVVERLAREVLSLPVHLGLSSADLETIVATVSSI